MKVVVSSKTKSYECSLSFPEGGGASAAYTALLVTKKLILGEIKQIGLVSLEDNIISANELLNFMKQVGWKGKKIDKEI